MKRLDIVNEVLAAIEQSPLSRSAIAERAGLSAAIMVYWFNGKTANPTLPALEKVAYVLGFHIAVLDGRKLTLEPIERIVAKPRQRVHIRRTWLVGAR